MILPPSLRRAERKNEISARRYSETKRREEKDGLRRKALSSPDEKNRLPFRLRKSEQLLSEDRIGVIYSVECGTDRETVVWNKDDSLKARRNGNLLDGK
jgi:hypothetical protein